MSAGSVRFGAGVRAVGSAVQRSLAFFLQPVFGSWSWAPPRWLQATASAAGSTRTWTRTHRRASGLGLLLLMLLAFAGYSGWQW